jgi:hypothetical protein
MFCAFCSEKILGESIKLSGESFCSQQCASLAAGLDPEEDSEYFEEDESVDDFFEEFDE